MVKIKQLGREYWRAGKDEDIKILGVLPHKSREFEFVIMGERWRGNYFTAKWDGESDYWRSGHYDLDKDEARKSLMVRAEV